METINLSYLVDPKITGITDHCDCQENENHLEGLTADSIPKIEGWSAWVPFYTASAWDCFTWKKWFELNVSKYGQAVAYDKFWEYWNEVPSRAEVKHFCSVHSNNEIRSFFRNTVNVRNPIADLVSGGQDVVSGVGETLSGVGNTVSFLGRNLQWVIVGVLIIVLIFVFYNSKVLLKRV